MFFGRKRSGCLAPLHISGSRIDYLQERKYQGTTIKSGTFFRASNSVLNALSGAHEHTLLTLLYTNCVPIFTYACAVKHYSASEMSDCNLAMNNAFRRIFGFSRWESIRTLREIFGFRSLYDIFKQTQDKFLNSCLSHPDPIIAYLSRLNL